MNARIGLVWEVGEVRAAGLVGVVGIVDFLREINTPMWATRKVGVIGVVCMSAIGAVCMGARRGKTGRSYKGVLHVYNKNNLTRQLRRSKNKLRIVGF